MTGESESDTDAGMSLRAANKCPHQTLPLLGVTGLLVPGKAYTSLVTQRKTQNLMYNVDAESVAESDR